MSGAILSIWTITANPSDFPGKHVARRHEIRAGAPVPTADHHVADTLEGARAFVPRGCAWLPRQHNDDPVIVENWI